MAVHVVRVELKLTEHLVRVKVVLPVHMMGLGVVLVLDAVGVVVVFAVHLMVVGVVLAFHVVESGAVFFAFVNFCRRHHDLLSVDFLATDITKQFDDIYDSLIEGESQTGSY